MATGYLDNFYARLGVSKNASPQQIRQAYHHAARRLHPDTNESEDATELFLQVQEAYEILSDPEKRKQYDRMRRLGAFSFGQGSRPPRPGPGGYEAPPPGGGTISVDRPQPIRARVIGGCPMDSARPCCRC